MKKFVDSEVLVQHRVLCLDVRLAHLDHIIGVRPQNVPTFPKDITCSNVKDFDLGHHKECYISNIKNQICATSPLGRSPIVSLSFDH